MLNFLIGVIVVLIFINIIVMIFNFYLSKTESIYARKYLQSAKDIPNYKVKTTCNSTNQRVSDSTLNMMSEIYSDPTNNDVNGSCISSSVNSQNGQITRLNLQMVDVDANVVPVGPKKKKTYEFSYNDDIGGYVSM